MVVAFVFGFLIAIVIDFILSLGAFSFQGTSSSPGVGQIIMSWLVTVAAFWVLYKMHRWAAYGMLGGFATLFIALALVGGLLGPYTCFSTYGYPR
jgi:riboflavin transporter FmnP